jgi:mannosylfructose-phosphate synthase
MAKISTRFLASPRPHVLMITNHGIHEWTITPGLPDTGGQNVFVNRFTAELARLGFKITIVNRGGYEHPATGKPRRGFHYKDAFQRILYLQDGLDAFVRKEEMASRIPQLVDACEEALALEGTDVELILSHYWDGAELGRRYNQRRAAPVPHYWVPHSLGTVKRRNVAPERWAELHIDERVAVEETLVQQVDGVAATSSTIREALREDYGYEGPDLFLPPCVDTDRYHPREVTAADPIWDFLRERSALAPDALRSRKIVTEISRTDTTKRKNVLIRAFAAAHADVPESLLIVTIDETSQPLAGELLALIEETGLQEDVIVLGSVWAWLPTLYAITDVYCTPSIMEGFGMSAEEAAATGVPVVASDRVPFATEYLLGVDVETVPVPGSDAPLRQGEGAVVVQADDVAGFAAALTRLLTDSALSRKIGSRGHAITVPYFTWSKQVPEFLEAIEATDVMD